MENVEKLMTMTTVSLLYEPNIGIKEVSLNLPKSGIYGFLGRNGAGKSTTLSVLSGVVRPQSGQLSFNTEQSPFVKTEWKKQIGYVPQTPIFPENLSPLQTAKFLSSLYPTWENQRFEKIVASFQLPIKRKIETFSVGMKTMLSVALAYACNPELYILDEPTAGLDPVSRRFVLDLIQQESERGKSIIFSTHIVDDLSDNCHFLGIIDAGEMLYEGHIADFTTGDETLEQCYFKLIDHHKITDSQDATV